MFKLNIFFEKLYSLYALLVIEVSSGEYGDFLEKMAAAVDTGHCYCWSHHASHIDLCSKNEESRTTSAR
jgi:hypothetical protein